MVIKRQLVQSIIGLAVNGSKTLRLGRKLVFLCITGRCTCYKNTGLLVPLANQEIGTAPYEMLVYLGLDSDVPEPPQNNRSTVR